MSMHVFFAKNVPGVKPGEVRTIEVLPEGEWVDVTDMTHEERAKVMMDIINPPPKPPTI